MTQQFVSYSNGEKSLPPPQKWGACCCHATMVTRGRKCGTIF